MSLEKAAPGHILTADYVNRLRTGVKAALGLSGGDGIHAIAGPTGIAIAREPTDDETSVEPLGATYAQLVTDATCPLGGLVVLQAGTGDDAPPVIVEGARPDTFGLMPIGVALEGGILNSAIIVQTDGVAYVKLDNASYAAAVPGDFVGTWAGQYEGHLSGVGQLQVLYKIDSPYCVCLFITAQPVVFRATAAPVGATITGKWSQSDGVVIQDNHTFAVLP